MQRRFGRRQESGRAHTTLVMNKYSVYYTGTDYICARFEGGLHTILIEPHQVSSIIQLYFIPPPTLAQMWMFQVTSTKDSHIIGIPRV